MEKEIELFDEEIADDAARWFDEVELFLSEAAGFNAEAMALARDCDDIKHRTLRALRFKTLATAREARLVEALEWYANPDRHIFVDEVSGRTILDRREDADRAINALNCKE